MSKQPLSFHKNNVDTKNVYDIYKHEDLTAIVQFIENKFYFATLIPGKTEPRQVANFYFFSIDDELVYHNFYDDFGPLSIACLYKYCQNVNRILKDDKNHVLKIVHFTSMNKEKQANAAFLIASYSVLYLNKTPEEAYMLVQSRGSLYLKPFQDAYVGVSMFRISLLDCLNALKIAEKYGLFNFQDFDVKEYEKYNKLKHGDLHWIVPRKFIAFLGPNTEEQSTVHYPEKYLNYFMKNKVNTVIRLNKKSYESFRFKNAGLTHHDMFFPDGTTPPKKILKQFLQVAETTKGPIAVHCKAGLGRTGTLIAAYLMKHYLMSATEAIAWLRICRPGSVIGHQQAWLEDIQSSLWNDGRHYREKYHGDPNLMTHHQWGIYSITKKHEKNSGNGEYLSKNSLTRVKSAKVTKAKDLKNISSRYQSVRGHATKLPVLLKEAKNSKELTQGAKLNEIKMKRQCISRCTSISDGRK